MAFRLVLFTLFARLVLELSQKNARTKVLPYPQFPTLDCCFSVRGGELLLQCPVLVG